MDKGNTDNRAESLLPGEEVLAMAGEIAASKLNKAETINSFGSMATRADSDFSLN